MSEVISIQGPVVPDELVREVQPIVALARSFQVKDVESDQLAQEYASKIRRGERTWFEYCEPARKAAEDAKKKILALRDGVLGPWSEARTIFSRKSLDYQAEERRKAEERERELREQASKQEEERQILAAIEAEEAGDGAEAEAILAQPVEAPAVSVAPAVAQVKGVSSRTVWSAEVESLGKLIAYVAAHPEWENLLLPNEVALNKMAVAQQRALSIPGVRSVNREVRSYR